MMTAWKFQSLLGKIIEDKTKLFNVTKTVSIPLR